MMPNNKPWSTKFGIRLNANSILPSFAGFIGLAGLHLGACGLIWWLNWPWWWCLSANIFILGLMIYTLERYIFSVTRYQLSFFFADNKGWVIQKDQNICYRDRAHQQFYYSGRKTLIFCAPLLTYFNICCATVLKNQRFLAQSSELLMRPKLRYAFCGKYIVILVFQNKLVLPIFFDSLPPSEFRQLRKVLILLDYV